MYALVEYMDPISSIGTLRKGSSSRSYMMETQVISIQGFWRFQLSLLALKFGEEMWKTSIGMLLRWAWRYIIWCLTSKCVLQQPIIFCWSNLENFPRKNERNNQPSPSNPTWIWACWPYPEHSRILLVQGGLHCLPWGGWALGFLPT